jgi:Putative transposase
LRRFQLHLSEKRVGAPTINLTVSALRFFFTVTLDRTDAVIRRFLIHVLPKDFHRIRHYGLFAGGAKAAGIATARKLLGMPAPAISAAAAHDDRITEAMLYAFDLLDLDGVDFRPLPLGKRKERLARLVD